jgi:GNAT superfamily N-acetyltransferase
MDIKYGNKISVEDFIFLRKSVGWGEMEIKLASNAIKNTLFIVTAIFENKIIGLTRVSGDGGYTVLIQDVIVLPDYQNKGIGKKLMEKAMEFIKEKFIKKDQNIFINLISAKDREPFYEKVGFEKRPNEKFGAGMSQWIKYE